MREKIKNKERAGMDIHYNYGQVIFIIIFLGLLFLTSYIDIKEKRIPDELCLALAVMAFAEAAIFQDAALNQKIAGALGMGILLLIISVISRGGIGGGDIKYMMAGGFMMGWNKILLAFAIGMMLAGIFGTVILLIKKANKRERIVLGPFLSVGMALGFLMENQIWNWL